MKCDWCYDKGEEVLLDLPGGPSIPCRSCNLGELVAAVMRDRTRPEAAFGKWIAVKDQQPEGDGDVLTYHPAFHAYGPPAAAIRSARMVRMWARDPEDKSMIDAYWMELPQLPQNDERKP